MKSSQEGLGDHGRFPPSLSLVGAKLKPGWMNKVMFDGDSARPFAHTRMPSFGEENLGFLPALFSQVDQLPEVKFPEIPRKKRGEMRSAGHKLVGDKGLNCVACHLFDGKSAGGLQGLDLLASYDRLKPDWFVPFMLNPAKYRPGIVMPSYWGDGQSTDKETLDGNATAQLQAIWHYLSYGQGAPTPSGIGNPGTNLEVEDRPRVYRGRSRVAGYRGFPSVSGRIHYAFNAETGALSALWKGEFVSVGGEVKERAISIPGPIRSACPRSRFSARGPKREALAGHTEDDQGEPGQSRSALSEELGIQVPWLFAR